MKCWLLEFFYLKFILVSVGIQYVCWALKIRKKWIGVDQIGFVTILRILQSVLVYLKYLFCLTWLYIRNTKLVSHKDVSNSTELGIWNMQTKLWILQNNLYLLCSMTWDCDCRYSYYYSSYLFDDILGLNKSS